MLIFFVIAYELALREARFFSWEDDTSKALVIIGDEVPHEPSYTTEKINWWEELDCLVNMGVKISKYCFIIINYYFTNNLIIV